MQTVGLFGLADRHGHWLTVRQQTVAENIAHINTPGYVAKQVGDFRSAMAMSAMTLAKTNARHIGPGSAGSTSDIVIQKKNNPDNAPVSLENELIQSLEVRRDFEINTSIVKAFNRMILSAAKG
ncbi:MAG: flagellar basal body rod protein FlgB [Rhizobiaceae bacterium]